MRPLTYTSVMHLAWYVAHTHTATHSLPSPHWDEGEYWKGKSEKTQGLR